jgi:hypothetical protein
VKVLANTQGEAIGANRKRQACGNISKSDGRGTEDSSSAMVHLVRWRTWGLLLSITESANVESTSNGVYWDNGSQRLGE